MAKTLYEKLGGYDAIAAVVDGLMVRLIEDPRLGRYFAGHGDDSKKRLRQLQKELICQSMGGPCLYLGRDMSTVHKGLGIDGTDWQKTITHLVGVLDSLKVPDELQKEILTMMNDIKSDIVEKP